MENNMKLLNKTFESSKIRTVWDNDEEKYYISVVDVIEVLTESNDPRKYWNWLKVKLMKEDNFETSSITRQLKLIDKDGKSSLTDVVDIEGMFILIEAIPSKKVEPIKLWLAHLLKSKNKDEHCSNCEYSLSSEVIDSIIEENSEYRDIPYDEAVKRIGHCELFETIDVPRKLDYWCPYYLKKEEQGSVKKLVPNKK